ncbi:MAG: phospholipase D family protein [Gammaproteobacteria bacterium]|nr:phospholipase D family protein [Gammaproteobacteria bacterium]
MTLLDPHRDRTLYTRALTPPPDCRFDCAVALTYSLNLDMLLAVPLHLLLHAGDRPDSELLADPVALLYGLRQTTDRITIFHQRGGIHPPRRSNILYSMLEDSLYAAAPRGGGIFHPKVWVLRFVSADDGNADGGAGRLVRLAVMSRNLTGDHSWDVSVMAQGHPRGDAVPENAELVALLHALPDMSPALPKARAAQVAKLAIDVEHTVWELPGHVDAFVLHAIGPGLKEWRPPRSRRLVVMSPFCTPNALFEMARGSDSPPTLVSRPEELTRIHHQAPAAMDRFERCLVLGELLDDSLHAKVYLCEVAGQTRLFVGSINATHHGSGAVEVMAELVGRPETLGTAETLLGEDGLGTLLEDFVPPDGPGPDPVLDRNKRILEDACGTVAAADLRLICHRGDGDGGSPWHLRLRSASSIDLSSDLEVGVWPITLPRNRVADGRPLLNGGEIAFVPMDIAQVTRFVAFSIDFRKKDPEVAPEVFVLCVPIDGLPVRERNDEIAGRIVRNQRGFLRYLLFLLGAFDTGAPRDGGETINGDSGAGAGGSDFGSLPLLEEMTRAYCRDPARLDTVRRLIQHLRESDLARDADDIVPDEFMQLWDTFEAALRAYP